MKYYHCRKDCNVTLVVHDGCVARINGEHSVDHLPEHDKTLIEEKKWRIFTPEEDALGHLEEWICKMLERIENLLVRIRMLQEKSTTPILMLEKAQVLELKNII